MRSWGARSEALRFPQPRRHRELVLLPVPELVVQDTHPGSASPFLGMPEDQLQIEGLGAMHAARHPFGAHSAANLVGGSRRERKRLLPLRELPPTRGHHGLRVPELPVDIQHGARQSEGDIGKIPQGDRQLWMTPPFSAAALGSKGSHTPVIRRSFRLAHSALRWGIFSPITPNSPGSSGS